LLHYPGEVQSKALCLSLPRKSMTSIEPRLESSLETAVSGEQVVAGAVVENKIVLVVELKDPGMRKSLPGSPETWVRRFYYSCRLAIADSPSLRCSGTMRLCIPCNLSSNCEYLHQKDLDSLRGHPCPGPRAWDSSSYSVAETTWV